MIMNNNTKGGLYDVLIGIGIVFIGGLLFVVLNVAMEGTGTGDGILDVAVDDLGINASSNEYKLVDTAWKAVPLLIMLGGLLFIIMQSQRKETDFVSFPA